MNGPAMSGSSTIAVERAVLLARQDILAAEDFALAPAAAVPARLIPPE
jgi:hypothetical protein